MTEIANDAGAIRPHLQHKFRVIVDGHPALTKQVITFKGGEIIRIVFRDDITDVVRDALNNQIGQYFDIKVELIDGDEILRTYDYPQHRMISYDEGEFNYASTANHTITVLLRKRREMDINVPT